MNRLTILFLLSVIIGLSCDTKSNSIDTEFECIVGFPLKIESVESFRDSISLCTKDKRIEVQAFRLNNGEYQEYDFLLKEFQPALLVSSSVENAFENIKGVCGKEPLKAGTYMVSQWNVLGQDSLYVVTTIYK